MAKTPMCPVCGDEMSTALRCVKCDTWIAKAHALARYEAPVESTRCDCGGMIPHLADECPDCGRSTD